MPMSPIEHVVIVFKENHTFDNYFASFPGADGADNLPAAPNPVGYGPFHTHRSWLRAQSDLTNLPAEAKCQFTRDVIPAYWSYAEEFTLCDRYFTGLPPDTAGCFSLPACG